jgi:uncharacterized membrane protein YbhN (UPF0104 family)
LGTGPFFDGIQSVRGGALAAASGVVLLATVCSAWRWKVVAEGLGVDLSLPAAVAAYYRAMFLNVTVPGGIIGDVHRGISHGCEVGDVNRALRAVAWERSAGQAVQIVLTLVVLAVLPSPVHSSMPWVTLAVAGAVLAVVLVVRAPIGRRWSPWVRFRNATSRDVRDGLLAEGAWLGIVLASVLTIAGHTVTFLIAARAAGATAPLAQMLPISLLVVLAMSLPSAGGWGPREGVAAWAFGVAGLGAQRGVATAVVYGVMVLVASLPGAAVLVLARFRSAQTRARAETAPRRHPAHA